MHNKLRRFLRAKSPPHRCRDGPAPSTTVGGGESWRASPLVRCTEISRAADPSTTDRPSQHRFRLEPEAVADS